MGLLDMCCQKKPKMTLDYIIKWVEDTDKTIKELSDAVQELNKWKEDISEETLKPIFDDYAETYPWDSVPAFDAKADKVENAVQGHLAALDSNGNLVDSGANIGAVIEEGNTDLVPSDTIYQALQGKADRVVGATTGNLASFDAEGNPQDSGTKPADFAAAAHSHASINKIATATGTSVAVTTKIDFQDNPAITLKTVKSDNAKTVDITIDNIDNLNRALENPESPTSGGTKYSTSGQIYGFVKGMLSHELTLEYDVRFQGMWGLLDISDNREFFDNIPFNTPVSIKFKCKKSGQAQVSGVSQHDFYVYGSLQINLEGQDDEKVVYIYINNAVYEGALAQFDDQDQDWVYQDAISLTKLQEDPFF